MMSSRPLFPHVVAPGAPALVLTISETGRVSRTSAPTTACTKPASKLTNTLQAEKNKKKCCHNQLGGPWPRNHALMAAESSDFSEKLVTVKVGKGDKQNSFTWLSSVLCFHSPFFVGALERSFKEAKERVITLEEDDPVIFKEFMRWVTDHRLGGFGSKSDNPHLSVVGFYHLLVRLYIFADKYMMPRLQNVIVDTIISTFIAEKIFFSPASVNLVYNRARDGAPLPALRKLMVDMFVLSCPDIQETLRSHSTKNNPYCSDFVQDAFYKYLGLTKDDARVLKDVMWWARVDRCYYHVAEPQPQGESKGTQQ